MKKLAASLFLMCLLPAGLFADQITTYNLNFQLTPLEVLEGYIYVPTGSFTYDSTSLSFTSFQVIAYELFDLTAAANNPTIVGNPCGGLTGAQALFDALAGQCPSGPGAEFGADTGTSQFGSSSSVSLSFFPTNLDSIKISGTVPIGPLPSSDAAFVVGTVTISAATPEPATSALTFLSVAIFLISQKQTPLKQAVILARGRCRA